MNTPPDPDHHEPALILDGTWRQALLVEELTDDEIQAIATAEVPPEHRYELPDVKE